MPRMFQISDHRDQDHCRSLVIRCCWGGFSLFFLFHSFGVPNPQVIAPLLLGVKRVFLNI